MEKMTSKFRKKNIRQRQGSALVMVLWIVIILSLIVGSFSFEAHIQSRITSFYRKRDKADAIALSGIQVARLLIAKSKKINPNMSEEEEVTLAFEKVDDIWFEDAKNLAKNNSVVIEQKIAGGTLRLHITSERSRRNVNKLKDDDWERIFELTNVPEDMWPELIDSFSDWIDKDGISRIDGAESDDYYMTLEEPYKARNGYLDSVGELLLIKGFTREIVYGGVMPETEDDIEPIIFDGFADMLTVYGDGKVDVNTADSRVLMTLPDVDELVAGAIVEEREGFFSEQEEIKAEPFKNEADFTARLELPSTIAKYITTKSGTYRITSEGTMGNITRSIWCVANYNRNKISYLRWRED
jgi:general secretion pathway protein K